MPRTFEDIVQKIDSYHKNRSVSIEDLNSIRIDCEITGPLRFCEGYIICENCNNTIRSKYLDQHKISGACERQKQRSKK